MTYQYQLLQHMTSANLNDLVNKALADGWELWGGPLLAIDGQGQVFCQAVVKCEAPIVATMKNELTGQTAEIDSAGNLFVHTLTDKPAAGYNTGAPGMVESAVPLMRIVPVELVFNASEGQIEPGDLVKFED